MDLISLIDEEKEHHPISPSAYNRWLSCPGSVRESVGAPRTSSAAAEEGTTAHALAEQALKNSINAHEVKGDYPPEMRIHIQQYLNYCRRYCGEKFWVEQKVKLHPYIYRGYGTADFISLDGDTLHIIDLKYGQGLKVEPLDNGQLYLYALGAWVSLNKHFSQLRRVVVHVAQPRLDHFDSAMLTEGELLAFGEHVRIAADKCLQPDAELLPTEKGCQWCPVKSNCLALYDHALSVVGNDFQPVTPEGMTDEQLKLVLDNKALITSWLKSVEDHVKQRLEQGNNFDGYKLVEGVTRRKYKADAQEKIKEILGDSAFDVKLKSITTLEKAIGKKRFKELDLTYRPSGKPTLALWHDKRQKIETF